MAVTALIRLVSIQVIKGVANPTTNNKKHYYVNRICFPYI